MSHVQPTLEECANILSQSGMYRVLVKLQPFTFISEAPDPALLKKGIYVDVETDGLDPDAPVIELAMLPFLYDTEIRSVGQPYNELNDPGRPIAPLITDLTGITDEALSGHHIDAGIVRSMLDGVSLIVSHNAKFDRRHAIKIDAEFGNIPWGCSLDDVPWRKEGAEATKLQTIANWLGFFFDGHRAAVDCYAGVACLVYPFPTSGTLGFSHLITRQVSPFIKISAIGAAFSRKDILKTAGYNWDGSRKVWSKQIPLDQKPVELKFLEQNVYMGPLEDSFIASVCKELTQGERFQ
jgi:DNA polymerase-3 subunit epsilon